MCSKLSLPRLYILINCIKKHQPLHQHQSSTFYFSVLLQLDDMVLLLINYKGKKYHQVIIIKCNQVIGDTITSTIPFLRLNKDEPAFTRHNQSSQVKELLGKDDKDTCLWVKFIAQCASDNRVSIYSRCSVPQQTKISITLL